MYCNFTKCQAFPFAIRASSSQQPKCFLQFYIKPQSPQILPNSNPKNTFCGSTVASFGTEKYQHYCQLLRFADRDSSVSFNHQFVGKKKEQVYDSIGFHAKPRKFSTSYTRKPVESTDPVKSLPWLAKNPKNTENLAATKRSSWADSAEKFLKNDVENSENGQRYDRRKEHNERIRNFKDESGEKFVKSGVESRRFDQRNDHRERTYDRRKDHKERIRNSEDESTEKFVKNGVHDRRFNRRNDHREMRRFEDDSDIENQENDNPRWYKIQERFDQERNGNEFRKWNRQDNWGKKVWKEETESSVPKMVGECVYGIGPVLAALSANRREFYVLYVQEGVDLSGNNRKKKDKKGFEKVLKVAEKLGLTIKETSKHDLNMIVENRPHQGLVLDASPLEMVSIRELDRVVHDGHEPGPVWLALDEVMDPQNLGAIIRSAYFFGASGVVVCAKNSAPLSGVVSKASAGSLELTELRSCKNMMQFLVSSAENGWRVLGGSVGSRAVGLGEVKTGEPTVLVLGSEGTGLRPLVERSCTQLVKIRGNMPVHAGAGSNDVEGEEFKSFLAVESLNVSVAAGVLLNHLVGINGGKNSVEIEG